MEFVETCRGASHYLFRSDTRFLGFFIPLEIVKKNHAVKLVVVRVPDSHSEFEILAGIDVASDFEPACSTV